MLYDLAVTIEIELRPVFRILILALERREKDI